MSDCHSYKCLIDGIHVELRVGYLILEGFWNHNQKDVEEINPTYRQDLQFHYVKNMMEVYQLALNS